MAVSVVKKASVIYGLVLATVLRIIVPFAVGSYALVECTKCSSAIVTYYSAICSALLIVTTLFLLNIRFADLAAIWILVAYIPLLIYMTGWTFYTLTERLENMKETYDAFMNELSQHWWSYVRSSNKTYWPSLEKKLQCCGLEGPRCYMDYLRKVPQRCYNPRLITLGCGHIVHDMFHPMQRIGHFGLIFTLFIELCLLYFNVIIAWKKLFPLIARRNHKQIIIVCKKLVPLIARRNHSQPVSKPSLNKSN